MQNIQETMKNDPKLAGKTFGRLTLIGQTENKQKWNCKCSCGKQTVTDVYTVLSGRAQSCGCLHHEIVVKPHPKTGAVIIRELYEYSSWNNAVQRCYNAKATSYPRYGAVGIRMCEYLRASVLNLIDAAGKRPQGTSIDRINNSGSYTCGKCSECLQKGWILNVRWATASQQGRNKITNKVITIGEETKCLAEWFELTGLKRNCLDHRLKSGYENESLLLPVNNQRKRPKAAIVE